DRHERALEIGGRDRVGHEQRPRVGVQAAPHLQANNAIDLQVMGLLIPFDRDAEIPTVPPVDLARRQPGTIKEYLHSYHLAPGRPGSGLGWFLPVLNILSLAVQIARLWCQYQHHRGNCGSSPSVVHMLLWTMCRPVPAC